MTTQLTPPPTITEPVPANVCAQMVESATRSCQPLIEVPPEPAISAVDSLAMLSTAFTFGSILLAIIALIAGFAWGKIVAASAEKEAKQVARDCAKEYVEKWIAENAPGIIRSQVDLLNDATIGEGDDANAADEIGKEA
jgi:hypothetical protein